MPKNPIAHQLVVSDDSDSDSSSESSCHLTDKSESNNFTPSHGEASEIGHIRIAENHDILIGINHGVIRDAIALSTAQ